MSVCRHAVYLRTLLTMFGQRATGFYNHPHDRFTRLRAVSVQREQSVKFLRVPLVSPVEIKHNGFFVEGFMRHAPLPIFGCQGPRVEVMYCPGVASFYHEQEPCRSHCIPSRLACMALSTEWLLYARLDELAT